MVVEELKCYCSTLLLYIINAFYPNIYDLCNDYIGKVKCFLKIMLAYSFIFMTF